MFPKLRRKFVILYTLSTGLIMTFILSVALLFYISSQENRQRSAFQEILFTLTAQLQTDSQFSDSFLAQMEKNNRLLIYIEENGTPFFFPGAYESRTERDILLTYANKAAENEDIYNDSHPISSNLLQSSVFRINGDENDAYLGNVLILRTATGYRRLTLLQDITHSRWKILETSCVYLLIDLCGILLLFLSGRWFVGRSLQPLEEAYEKQQEFVAAVSHELRSPFAVIQATADSIVQATTNALVQAAADTGVLMPTDSAVQTAADSIAQATTDTAVPMPADSIVSSLEECRRGLSIVQKECRRGSSLIKNLLLLMTADQKEWAVREQEFDIDELLLNLLEMYEPVCYSKGGTLLLLLPDTPLPRVSADPDLCRQIFTILLDNAIAYALPDETFTDKKSADGKHNRQIILQAEASPGRLTVCVIDHGPGIPDEEKSRIFDRFYRSDRSRSRKEHFGLGLAIAASLAGIQGIKLDVKDTDGGGSTFSVRF